MKTKAMQRSGQKSELSERGGRDGDGDLGGGWADVCGCGGEAEWWWWWGIMVVGNARMSRVEWDSLLREHPER